MTKDNNTKIHKGRTASRGLARSLVPVAGVLAVSLFCATLFSSCIREQNPGPNVPGKYVTLYLNVPYNSRDNSSSRALDADTEENYVDEIDILIFNSDGTFKEVAEGSNITTDGSNTRLKKFETTLPYGPDMDLIVLANCRQQIQDAALEEDVDLKADVINSLLFDKEVWGLSSATFVPFPMWGEIGNVTVDDNLDMTGTVIKMLRLTARIDVVLDDAFFSQAGFQYYLKSVRLYNRHTKGQIIPTPGNYIETSTALEATAPSIPAVGGTAVPKTRGPLYYDVPSPYKEITSSIYTFEAPAGSFNDLPGNTCLVVGLGPGDDDGKGGGATSVPSTRTPGAEILYYRVDFIQKDSNPDVYMPILRNHNYVVTIKDVVNDGFPDPDQAFRSELYDLDYEIMDMERHEFNYGQYRLDISETFLFVNYRGAEVTVRITSTHPDGWSYMLSDSYNSITTGPTWIKDVTLSGDSSIPNNPIDMTFTVDAMPNPTPRYGYIHITSGNLTNVISVWQEWPQD